LGYLFSEVSKLDNSYGSVADRCCEKRVAEVGEISRTKIKERQPFEIVTRGLVNTEQAEVAEPHECNKSNYQSKSSSQSLNHVTIILIFQGHMVTGQILTEESSKSKMAA
jgi:hypothetical protein